MSAEQGYIAQEKRIEQMIRDLMDAAALSHNAEDVVAEDEAVEAILDEVTEYAAERVADALSEGQSPSPAKSLGNGGVASPEQRGDAELLAILRDAYTCYLDGRTGEGEYSLIHAIEMVLRRASDAKEPLPVSPGTASDAEPSDWRDELREAWEDWMASDEAPDADAASDRFARLAIAIQDIYGASGSDFLTRRTESTGLHASVTPDQIGGWITLQMVTRSLANTPEAAKWRVLLAAFLAVTKPDHQPKPGERDPDLPQWDIVRLRTALQNHGRHHEWCNQVCTDDQPCNCGYADALRIGEYAMADAIDLRTQPQKPVAPAGKLDELLGEYGYACSSHHHPTHIEAARKAVLDHIAGVMSAGRQTSTCRGCHRPLDPAMTNVADGCPCNSPRGINHGLVPTFVCTCVECDPAQTGSARATAETRDAGQERKNGE